MSAKYEGTTSIKTGNCGKHLFLPLCTHIKLCKKTYLLFYVLICQIIPIKLLILVLTKQF